MEPYYESLEQPHKQHVQPAEYEEFQPSSTTTITSQLPLLNQDPEPYEVIGGGAGSTLEDGHMNGVYETSNTTTTTSKIEQGVTYETSATDIPTSSNQAYDHLQTEKA